MTLTTALAIYAGVCLAILGLFFHPRLGERQQGCGQTGTERAGSIDHHDNGSAS